MTSEITFSSTKAARNAREYVEKRNKERKIQLICLIKQYLEDEGCANAAKILVSEFPAIKDYTVCDNIDLKTVLLEYENYHYARYERYPKLCKKLESEDLNVNIERSQKNKTVHRARSASKMHEVEFNKDKIKTLAKEKASNCASLIPVEPNCITPNYGKTTDLGFGVSVFPLGPRSDTFDSNTQNKTIGMFQYNPLGCTELGQQISKAIMNENYKTTWSDIIGHENVKRILAEAILYPIKYPKLFKFVRPWNSLLLFGPPGTGPSAIVIEEVDALISKRDMSMEHEASRRSKTELLVQMDRIIHHNMFHEERVFVLATSNIQWLSKSLLVKAISNEFQVTMIHVSPSMIISKWRGDSEKAVKEVFDLALSKAPSAIVIEEVDALISKRDMSMEHEASRRSKTELLVQMDRIIHHNMFHEERVFVLATSNIPWDIDVAMIRRLEKRVLVDLPSFHERQNLFEYYLSHSAAESLDFMELAQVSDGYSGSDVSDVCNESLMEKVREVIKRLETTKIGKEECCNLQPKAVTTADVKHALIRNKSTALEFSEKYQQWNKSFGAS